MKDIIATTPLLTNPCWRPEDLGTPLPNSVHAVSVAMPTWQDVVDYEEGKERVLHALKAGYPRFVYHPITRKLFAACEQELAKPSEFCLIFPSRNIAERAVAFVKEKSGEIGQVTEWQGVYATLFPESARAIAKSFWQHAGLIISSRWAEALLEKRQISSGDAAKRTLRSRVGELNGEVAENTYLFPSAMGGIFIIHELLSQRSPGKKTIQIGFPYLDTLKIQEKFGSGVHFIRYDSDTDIKKVRTILEQEKVAGVFCEFPSNPLLKSVDMPALSALLRSYNVPLVVDDTIATPINVDLKPYADVIVTSLTKFFSGVGDVLGGSVVLNRASPHYQTLKTLLDKQYEDVFFAEDAIVLEQNSRDFATRLQRITQTAEILCDALKSHPAVAEIYYPKYITQDAYNRIKKPQGGYGGLFSLTLKNPAKAPLVYNNLEVDKGPSLGTNFTLACPYTILAHYQELDFAASHGVDANLIRVSVGLEEPEDLVGRFRRALEWAT